MQHMRMGQRSGLVKTVACSKKLVSKLDKDPTHVTWAACGVCDLTVDSLCGSYGVCLTQNYGVESHLPIIKPL